MFENMTLPILEMFCFNDGHDLKFYIPENSNSFTSWKTRSRMSIEVQCILPVTESGIGRCSIKASTGHSWKQTTTK